MRPECIQAVQQAAGRKLTESQLADIDSRMARTMRQLARTEKDWQGLSRDQRLSMAADRAVKDIAEEAARKIENAQLQVVKTAATQARIDDALRLFHGDKHAQALVHDIDKTGEYVQGIKMESLGNLINLLDAVKSGEGTTLGRRAAMFLFDAQNPQMTRDLAAEIFRNADGHTGNAVAKQGAQAWLKVIEDLRQRFNSGGGDVGKLDYGYLPQPHDQARVRQAGADAWVAKIMPALDRGRYVDEAGARLSDAEVSGILHQAWETISTDGLNKQEPGAFKGTGARANRGSEAREIHFKDSEAFLGYLADFGRGSMYDAMVSHVGRLSRDIGLVERYGPNPNATMRLQFDLAAHADGSKPDNLARSFGLRPQSYWDAINGTASSPASARIAQIGTDIRNVQTFGKLAGAVISSITDVGTYMVTTGFNKLSYWDAFANYARVAGNRPTRDFLTTHGIIAESMINDMNRWTNDNIKQTWSGRLAQSTLKLSMMNLWTDTLRRSFSLTMMQGLAKLSKNEWGALGEWDRTHLERAGITPEDWAVISKAELTHFGGKDHLTPESIHATGNERSSEIVSKVLGMIQDESEFAVINPDLATKALASGGSMQRGTIRGELARSVSQFKSFPIAMVSRHWRRALDAPTVSDGSAPMMANRTVYLGSMMITTTILGAIALQAKQIVSGKDPIDMTGEHAAKFWGKAVAQGGGLSIVGDTLLNDPGNSYTDFGTNLGKTLLGPGAGTAIDAASIGVGNAWQVAKGKKTHAAAETVNLMRQNTPYVNLWYAKAALDHAGMHALQENLSPGYLGRMQQNAKKDFGQDYWWKPGNGGPERAPNIAGAVGQ